ncbi:ragulator complex protein LAMTOR4 [Ixodes scapularis]
MMHGWMEKIPDQVGFLILNSDGGVISSGGELENEERIGGIIHKMVYCADKSDLMPTDNRDPVNRMSKEAADKEYQCRICVNAGEMEGMLEMIRGELGKEREARKRMEVKMIEAREGLRDEKGENKGVDGGELGGQRKGTHLQ